METLNEIWIFIDSIGWIIVILALIAGCYVLYRAGKYRDPGQENTYFAAIKKQTPFQCPYDTEGRSCKWVDGATGYKNKPCDECDWYNNGIRPSKFGR